MHSTLSGTVDELLQKALQDAADLRDRVLTLEAEARATQQIVGILKLILDRSGAAKPLSIVEALAKHAEVAAERQFDDPLAIQVNAVFAATLKELALFGETDTSPPPPQFEVIIGGRTD